MPSKNDRVSHAFNINVRLVLAPYTVSHANLVEIASGSKSLRGPKR